MAGLAGNVCLILVSTMATTSSIEEDGLYRLVSSALGGFGLYSYYKFSKLGEWDYQTQLGLWQRGTLYPVLFWNVATALFTFGAWMGDGDNATAGKPKKA